MAEGIAAVAAASLQGPPTLWSSARRRALLPFPKNVQRWLQEPHTCARQAVQGQQQGALVEEAFQGSIAYGKNSKPEPDQRGAEALCSLASSSARLHGTVKTPETGRAQPHSETNEPRAEREGSRKAQGAAGTTSREVSGKSQCSQAIKPSNPLEVKEQAQDVAAFLQTVMCLITWS